MYLHEYFKFLSLHIWIFFSRRIFVLKKKTPLIIISWSLQMYKQNSYGNKFWQTKAPFFIQRIIYFPSFLCLKKPVSLTPPFMAIHENYLYYIVILIVIIHTKIHEVFFLFTSEFYFSKYYIFHLKLTIATLSPIWVS